MWNFVAIDESLGLIAFGQATLAAVVLIVAGRHRSIVLPLALFFVANAVTDLEDVIDAVSLPSMPISVGHCLTVLSMLGNLTLAPLLWLYVRGLTSENYPRYSSKDAVHFVGLMLGFGMVVLALVMPFDQRDRIFGDGVVPLSQTGKAVILYVVFVMLAFYVQCGAYITAILLRLATYRVRLKDIFASTEDRELGWISGLAMVAGVYWFYSMCITVLETFFGHDAGLDLPERVFNIILITFLAAWGLRQKPGFDVVHHAPELAEPVKPAIKYERSALSAEHVNRIAAKIHKAMEEDLLFRDPNLSLWMLAKHIAVTSNYVSQTLNTTIGETFFDYVNRWRIEEAKPLIRDGQETVLAIAYEVGFNSRSSFYTAFKRETGMTPTQYKNAG